MDGSVVNSEDSSKSERAGFDALKKQMSNDTRQNSGNGSVAQPVQPGVVRALQTALIGQHHQSSIMCLGLQLSICVRAQYLQFLILDDEPNKR